MLFSTVEFHFENNGIFRQKFQGEMLNGSYKVNTKDNVIELTSKNSLNEDVTDYIRFNLKNGLLSLIIKWDDDDEEFHFVLEKI